MIYTSKVSTILAGRTDYRMPLVQSGSAESELVSTPAQELFPGAPAPEAAKAGLLLYLGDWEGAHSVSQDISSVEGSYWHALVHRQEPDAGNSLYWFRQVGSHPIFALLQKDAALIVTRYPEAGIALAAEWNPEAFIDLCENARRKPGSELERAAIEIQHAEWLRLFQWCAATKG
jgi:hypothetical protein